MAGNPTGIRGWLTVEEKREGDWCSRNFTKSGKVPRIPVGQGGDRSALTPLLERIPDGWAPKVDCGPGWHPLLLELDRELAALEPRYIIYQMKEKFGGLRFYFGVPELEPACCQVFKSEFPCPFPEYVPVLSEEAERQLQVWQERFAEHTATSGCVAACAALADARAAQLDLLERMRSLVNDYELRSLTLCEETGGRGRLMVRDGVFRTLAQDFAVDGWAPVGGELPS